MPYMIRIYRYRGDYSAMAPDLPGCIAVAESVEGVCKLMAEAIALHLDMMRRSGESIPKPSKHLDFTIEKDAEQGFCTWVEPKWPATSQSPKRPANRRRSSKQLAR